VYVFALLAHKEKETVDPLDVDQWQFFVLSTSVLDHEFGNQTMVGISTLAKLAPPVDYDRLNELLTNVHRVYS